MHRKRIEIRWRDLDGFGHVNNATYLTYLEEARDEMFKLLLERSAVERIVIRRLEIDYRSALSEEDDHAVVEVRVARVGESSVTTRERILAASDGRVAAESTSVVVYTDGRRAAKNVLPEDVRRRLEAEL